jgi:hypothetical protein
MHKSIFITALSIVAVMCFSQTGWPAKTRIQTHSAFESFKRGSLEGVMIDETGSLRLAPRRTLKMDTGDPFVWDLQPDNEGGVYIATGNDGRVYHVTASGDSVLYFDAPELEVFALCLDSKGVLYAATSPDGKVYRIPRKGTSSVAFDPAARYIWDLTIDASDQIYVATGEPGMIFRLSSSGKPTRMINEELSHIRTVLLTRDNRLYAGSSQPGYVFRVRNDGSIFVLFDTQMDDVHQLVGGENGLLYAAVFNEPRPSAQEAMARARAAANRQQDSDQQNGDEVELTQQAIMPTLAMPLAQAQTSLFRIDTTGYARDIWSFPDQSIQSVISDDRGRLWVGTSGEGSLYTYNRNGEALLVFKGSESEITALAAGRGETTWLATSNMGRCYHLASESERKGTFISEVIDSGEQSTWGVLNWDGNAQTNAIHFWTRTGNTEQPGASWSAWQPVRIEDQPARIPNPSARFIQWKCQLNGQSSSTPVIDEVSIAYKQFNRSPHLSSVIVHSPGKYIDLDDVRNKASSQLREHEGLFYPVSLPDDEEKQHFRSVDWIFDDPNMDALLFSVYYKRTQDKGWRTLVTDWDLNAYSWDSTTMADGEYRIKVVVTDSLNNSADVAQTDFKISQPFFIDNTPPELVAFSTTRQEEMRKIHFTVQDQYHLLGPVEYSVNAGKWQPVYPVDGMMDSKQEAFTVSLTTQHPQIDIAIRIIDEIGNRRVIHKEVQR